jgi:hypothetical protein
VLDDTRPPPNDSEVLAWIARKEPPRAENVFFLVLSDGAAKYTPLIMIPMALVPGAAFVFVEALSFQRKRST